MGNNLSEKQETIRKLLEDKTNGNWENYNQYERDVKMSFTEKEKSYLNEDRVRDFYENILNKNWSKIENKKKDEISNKLFILCTNDLFKSKEELENSFKSTLSNGEKNFMEENIREYIQKLIDGFWEVNKSILNKKKEQFKETLEYKIIEFYNKKENCNSLEQFKTKFENNLLLKDRELLKDNDINMLYNRMIKIYWDKIKENNKNIIKEIFYKTIKYKIKNICFSKDYTNREDFEKEVIKSLSNEENDLIREDLGTFDAEIYKHFQNCLNIFWNKVKNEKNYKIQKDIRMIKDKINSIIMNRYPFYDTLETKEEFSKKIKIDINSNLNEKENKIKEENDEIIKFEENMINLFWKKI